MITAGTYKARVQGECVLGTSKSKGTPFIEFYLTILEGEHKGSRARWTGYFTENTNERTIQSLQICGWAGDDVSDFTDGMLHGLDSNEVEIVVELEEYEVVDKESGQKTGETKTSAKVAWINRAGGFLNKAAAMNEGAAKAFGAKMRGLVLKAKEKTPVVQQTKPAAAKPAATRAPAPATGADFGDYDSSGDEIPF